MVTWTEDWDDSGNGTKKRWVGCGFVKWRVMNTDTSDIFCQKYFNK